ncbi:uncharacterized protein LOC120332561 [Styela clava]|uniref:uncharacterized protein LOC120332561 n=1 Tax=Styela clava TaxID=7725 RepID=UPI00193A0C6A|nr:uncharacterized protein LOC120332561 [Styela clava]
MTMSTIDTILPVLNILLLCFASGYSVFEFEFDEENKVYALAQSSMGHCGFDISKVDAYCYWNVKTETWKCAYTCKPGYFVLVIDDNTYPFIVEDCNYKEDEWLENRCVPEQDVDHFCLGDYVEQIDLCPYSIDALLTWYNETDDYMFKRPPFQAQSLGFLLQVQLQVENDNDVQRSFKSKRKNTCQVSGYFPCTTLSMCPWQRKGKKCGAVTQCGFDCNRIQCMKYCLRCKRGRLAAKCFQYKTFA